MQGISPARVNMAFVHVLCSLTCATVRPVQVMWEVLGLLVRHQGRLKSSAPPSKKDDSSAEAQLAAVLVSWAGM